ncbi:MAG TPA: hypothetical protein VOB72_06630, partial [Candidatus Dormibacteraeota bacterium]|nr:hypothetical protein [Candidatus Dormibacteraeota bacterium]
PGGLAALVLRAALLREESRGAHVRVDRPDEDLAWGELEVVARGEAAELVVRPRAGRVAAVS